MSDLQLWGGHECTVNRVGDTFHDQTRRSGHQDRIEDLDRFADLGLTALRYPILWERTAPDRPDQMDFTWSDARLGRIRTLGIEPIVGLVHHGGGPRYTNLVDDGFAPGLAAYAGAVARRYPDIRDWTPVNEPLTTARFSCLYGHWYPHIRDEAFFWIALLNQIDAVRLTMREVRKVRSDARLIQTEDLGRTYSTRALARQADFENERRWLTWDLLEGRVKPGHPLYQRIAGFRLGDRLAAIADDPCPPDVIGVNHYLTSERFLDERLERYPPERVGGNGDLAYADVEAVRVLLPAPAGLEGVLEEAWARYGRTLAVTEAHNGCTREEQVRWVEEAWETAVGLRGRGVDVAAVTAWALLGSYDWNSLLTRRQGYYESGAFDLRGGEPRPTALTAALKRLSGRGGPSPPAVAGPGWWRRDIRLSFEPVLRNVHSPEPKTRLRGAASCSQPILITGATGVLGKAVARACEWRGIDYLLTDRSMVPLDEPERIETALDQIQPWAVINAAGWVRVDDAEDNEDACRAANTHGAIRLAEACARRGMAFVGFSSDLVFDGQARRPYVESDDCRPLNAYGRSKADAEREILAMGGANLMVRTAAFFSPHDPYNFAAQVQRSLALGQPFTAAEDLVVSPTYVPDLVDAVLDLTIDGEVGLWHLANAGAVSWAEFARMIARAHGFDPAQVHGAACASFGWPARRPTYAALASERAALLPDLEKAIARHAAAVGASMTIAGEAELQRRATPAAGRRLQAAITP
jgi:dTDP-4-dehydrorhamnose reductase